MSGLSRRMFLKQGSLAVAAVGAVSAVPGLPLLVSSLEADAPAAGSAMGETSALTETLVAHIKDVQTGEISLYLGEREITYQDPRLAALIHQATR
jgi:hypothetical protein